MQAAEINRRGIGRLSPREIEVLRLTSQGESCKVAARTLGISIETVKDHRRMAAMKLRAENMPHAVAIAMTSRENSDNSMPG